MAQRGRQPFWRKKFYVHAIQRKYFFLSLVPLVVCGFLLAFFVLFPLHLTLWGTATDPERAATLQQVAAIVSVRIWFAIIISMITSGLLSYFVTNKFAGPLYRIEQILREVADGNLPTTVRIRRNDDLQDFAGLFDRAFKTIGYAMTAVTEHQTHAARELAELHRKVKAELDGEVLQGLEEISRSHREVQHILENFQPPLLRAPNPESKKE